MGKGTGLGLSQVFGFARQSGGEIVVESVLGGGTSFTLYLPRTSAPAAVVTAPEPDHLIESHGLRALLVEDNAEVGTFATQALAELGYQTVWATDGAMALSELAKPGSHFDVIFSDVIMPGISGIELGRKVREIYPDMPIVLTSGYSHVLAEHGTYGFDLLHKPYSLDQLSSILMKAVAAHKQTGGN